VAQTSLISEHSMNILKTGNFVYGYTLRQEVEDNLKLVSHFAIKNNVPVYMRPNEQIDNEELNFLLV
jgi:hypothetical protein